MADENANGAVQVVRKSLDGGNFAFDAFSGLSEAGIVGTLTYAGLGALANLPVVVIAQTYILPVSVAIAVSVAMIQIGKAFRRNYM